VKRNEEEFQFAKEDLRADTEFVLDLVERNLRVIQFAKDPSEGFAYISDVVKKNQSVLQFVFR